MISRGLIVSLGTTSLVSVLLFLYFRNRMTSVERKVSMLFKLIEDHHQQQQVQFMQRMKPEPPQQNNLINVSDGEESVSGSDTEYETDSESGKLSIQEGDVKTIELTQKVQELPFQEQHQEQHPYQSSPPQEYHDDELDQIPPLEELNVTKTTNEAPKEIHVDIQPNFKDLKIKELKKICGERGLTKYSHLNKAALVNLLEQS